MARARLKSTYWEVMSVLQAELHSRLDVFEGQVSAPFSNIKIPDHGDIREGVNVLRVEVRSLIESPMLDIPPVVPIFI